MAGPPPRFGLVRRVELPPPTEALLGLSGRPHVAFRHAASVGHRGLPFSYLMCDPVALAPVQALEAPGDLARALAPVAAQRVRRTGPRLPFAGGWVGVLAYEARSGVEARPPARPSPAGWPAVWLAHYDAAFAWDHRRRRAYVAGLGEDEAAAQRATARLEARLEAATLAAPGPVHATAPRQRTDGAAFRQAVDVTREAIREGEVFQVNLSHAYETQVKGRPVDVFLRLASSQPAPYMTYVDLGEGRTVLSATPERFLRVRGRTVETDPMKGTRPRGATRREDDALRRELQACEKERAELAMIVDLSRNDVSRVCEPGTVEVVVPRRLLRLPRVHQAIAVVRGRLARGCSRIDLLAAAFPPGSVTGAPKVRAMEIIDSYEQEGRGPYCGALGLLDEGGDMDMAVAIRTVFMADGLATYRVGGGITLRSDAEAEWRETLVKGRGLYHALAGEEQERE